MRSRVCLGIANSDTSEEARDFLKELQAVGVTGADNLHNLQTFNIKDDAIVLYQEKAGIPLAHYAELVELGRLYDNSPRISETHLDYRALKDRLPEIRLVDHERQQSLAESLENVFYGIMTGVLSHDAHNFKLNMRQAGGGHLTFPVGNRPEEITNLLRRQSQRPRRTHQAGGRLDGRGGRQELDRLLGLWCAIQHLHEEIRRRVQHLIDRGQVKMDHEEGKELHPLMHILGRRMLPRVRDRLAGVPGTEGFDNSSLNWDHVFTLTVKRHLSEPEKVGVWLGWKKQFEGCLKLIHEDNLPIPVVQPAIKLTAVPSDGERLVSGEPGKYLLF